ncbi:MAG TPA: ABC transporter permease [Chloroflexota bacterium]|nr:ABC transporter permease [Chloroflexota bacterium]
MRSQQQPSEPEHLRAATRVSPAARVLSLVQRETALIVLVLLVIMCSLLSPHFLTGNNIGNLADQMAVFGVLACGQMLPILSGGIDLSVGSVLALGAFFAAAMSSHGIFAAVVVALAATGIVGFVNGIGIAYTRVPPFIITLAMLSIARGLSLQFASMANNASTSGAGAAPVSVAPGSGFQNVAETPLPFLPWNIPSGALIAALVFVALAFVLRYTSFGRHVFAVGGNEAAAMLLGVRVHRVKIAVYTFSGMLAGLAGILYASRQVSAPPTAGVTYELDAIAAVAVGGTLLTGGVGTVRGTVVGLLIIQILPNIFNLLGLGSNWQQVARGVVLLAVVILQMVILPALSIGGIPMRRGPEARGPAPTTPAPGAT